MDIIWKLYKIRLKPVLLSYKCKGLVYSQDAKEPEMRAKAQTDDQRWALSRAPAYSKALSAAAKRRFKNVYRYILEAERLVLATEGTPPGVITQDVVSATSAEMVEAASVLDAEYDEENYEHHAPRVRCFFYKGILVCFTVCEVNELITMTCFKQPEEHDIELGLNLANLTGTLGVPHAPSSGSVMELNRQSDPAPSYYYRCEDRDWHAPPLNKPVSRLILQSIEGLNITLPKCDLWAVEVSPQSDSMLSKCVWQTTLSLPGCVTLWHTADSKDFGRPISVRGLKAFKVLALRFRK